MSAPHAKLPQPSLEECLGIIDQMAACGVPFVSLTGGEPLVRSDFLELVDHILSRGMHISVIMSNGSLVTEELLCALEERGVRCEFNMSFDGVDGWHDWLRGVVSPNPTQASSHGCRGVARTGGSAPHRRCGGIPSRSF